MPEDRTFLMYCRLCQSKEGTCKLLGDDNLVNQIYECTNLKVFDLPFLCLFWCWIDDFQLDDVLNKLPQSVCEECQNIVQTFHSFLKRVKAVDVALRKRLKTEEKQFHCPECNKTYSKLGSLQFHKRSHDNLFCLKCEITFDDTGEKNVHLCQDTSEIVNENSDKKRTFQCTLCEQTFFLRVDFSLHKKLHRNTFICKVANCGKICSSAYSLKTHELKHQNKRPYLCVTCGKGFITKNSLNCHEKIHLEVKSYTCTICNIGFSVRSNLRAHEKKHHEGVRFYCSKCTKVFITKSSLDRHEKIHTGIKEFQCESCPSAFYTAKELMKHQRYHQGERRHKCGQCFKAFFEKHHLTVHLRTHSGEKPYVCKSEGCNRAFVESQKLTRHMKAKHAM